MRDKRREQEEYRERQERRRKQLERNQRRRSYQSYELRDQMRDEVESYDLDLEHMSPARQRMERKKREQQGTAYGQDSRRRGVQEREVRGRTRQDHKPTNRELRQMHREDKRIDASNKMGMRLSKIQILVSVIFIGILFFVNVLPIIYSAIIAAVVLVIAGAVYLSMKRKNKKHGASKVISVVMTLLLILGSFYLIRGYLILIDMGGSNDSTLNLNKDTYSVYISGIDVYGEVTETSRSDVNLIATVNPKTHQVLLTTTPRDYYVEIPGVSNGEKDKLTHAGIYGIDKSMATLEHVYDEKVDFYIRVNFTSVIDIVDALGGVTVDAAQSFTTGEDAGCVVDIKEGKNKLNGQQALAFARERHALEDGDNQRGKNQQILLKGIYKSMMTPAILFNMNGVLSSIDGNVETNMTKSQLQSFSKGVLGGGTGMNFYSVAAEGTQARKHCYSYPGKSLYVCVPDETSVANIKALMDSVGNGEILPEQE